MPIPILVPELSSGPVLPLWGDEPPPGLEEPPPGFDEPPLSLGKGIPLLPAPVLLSDDDGGEEAADPVRTGVVLSTVGLGLGLGAGLPVVGPDPGAGPLVGVP